MVVTGREEEGSGVDQPEVQLHVPRLGIGQTVAHGGIFHPPLPAVVDGQHSPPGDKAAFKAAHVKIVEAEHHAGEDLVDGHGPFAAAAVELPHRAAVALGQQKGPLICKGIPIHG